MSPTTPDAPIFAVDHPAYVATEGTRIEVPWGLIRFFTGKGARPSETTVGLCQVRPGAAMPVHYHPNCEETIHILSGRCAHMYGQDTVDLGPGQTLLIPRYVVHRATAVGPDPLEFLIVFSSGEREAVFLEEPA